MVDSPRQAATRRKALELLARLEREQNTPEAIAERAERRGRIRRDEINARLDAASAETAARAARGEMTPEQEARREVLNAKWITKDDRGGRMSDEEFREMQRLNSIQARRPPPAPVRPAPQPASAQKARKQMKGLTEAVVAAVGKEIAEHQRERKLQAERIEHDRELQAARVETALARLDAILARAENASSGKDREGPQSRFIVTR